MPTIDKGKTDMQIIENSISIDALKERLNVFGSNILVQVRIRELKSKPEDNKEQERKARKMEAVQALLNSKPSKGRTDKSVVDILREIRDTE